MKVAIVHDYLNQFGGAERVLEVFAGMYPEAPIKTLFYDKDKLEGRFADRVVPGPLDNKFIKNNHRPFIPFFPFASHMMDAREADLVISNSVGFAKAAKVAESAKHIFYCNAMLRYAWDPKTHFRDFIPKPLRPLAYPAAAVMRKWDKWTGMRPDMIVSNSEYTRDRILRFYGRESEIIYPPVDTDIFYPEKSSERGYYLAVGRLIPYKKFDLLVETFNELRLPLLIVGDGRDYDRLKGMTRSPLIRFTGFVDDPEELRKIYSKAKAFLFPQVEDFGLVAAEALCCGTPVVGFNAAGAKEMILNEVNGVIFNAQNCASIKKAVLECERIDFSPERVAKTAERFSKKTFVSKFKDLVSRLMGN